jgi:hypothetical protein
MILHCSFEEVTALSAAAERALAGSGGGGIVVSAPPDILAEIESVAPSFIGDIEVGTLAEQDQLLRVMEYMLLDLHERMDAAVLEYHAADETAVALYFEYAHVLTATDRLRRLGAEMRAVIELVTGTPPDAEAAADFTFPD